MKNLFNAKLYREALSQLKLIFYTFLIGVIGISVVIFIANYKYIDESHIYSITEISPLIMTVAYIASPCMVLTLFGFLTKRNLSDFYHVIPHKRECIFISFCAAIITMITSILVISTIVISLLYEIACPKFYMNYKGTFVIILNFIIIAFCIMSVMLIGMNLSGIKLNAIIIALVIVFFPRTLIETYLSVLNDELPIFSKVHTLGIFNAKNNLVAGIPYQLDYALSDISTLFISKTAGVYTFLLGVIYIAIAFILFKKRKSEVAGNFAASKAVKFTTGILITLFVCFAACGMIFSNIVSEYSHYETSEVATIYAIAFFVFVCYEFIVSRKITAIVKASPKLLLIAVLNLAYIGTMYLGYNSAINFKPDADEINYISLCSYVDYYDYGNYFTYATANVKIKNEHLNKLVSGNLKNAVNNYENVQQQNGPVNDYNEITFKISSNGRVCYRNLRLSREEYQNYITIIAECDDLVNVYRNLPDAKDCFMINEKLTPVYEKYVAELKSLDDETLKKYVANQHTQQFYTYVNIGTQTYVVYVSLNEYTPKAYKAYIELSAPNSDENFNYFNTCDDIKRLYIDYANSYYYGYPTLQTNNIDKLHNLINTHKDPQLDITHNVYKVIFYDSKGKGKTFIFSSNSPELDEYINELNYTSY